MVYVYAKQSELNKYIQKDLTLEEIKETLVDLGMDIKGQTDSKNPELKIELTAEKFEMVSSLGIGRAIKYYRELEKKVPRYNIEKSEFEVIVKKSAKLSRPKTVCAILKQVPNNADFLSEIIKIQEKIHDSFGRGRKKGAIGIYPLNKIKFPITYESKLPEEIVFQTLETDSKLNANQILKNTNIGKKYAHLLKDYQKYPVFIDANNLILSMPPIINSYQVGKVENYHKDLFIECSGYNLSHIDNILKVLVTTFIEMGAKAQSVLVKYEDDENKNYQLNLENSFEEIQIDYINKLIGIELKTENIEKYLNKMMYGLKSIQENKIIVEIPVFRCDVWNKCDIADDIARSYGYNNIKPTFPNISSIGKSLEETDFEESFSKNLVNCGFLELYTYILTSTQIQFNKMDLNYKDFEFVKLIDSQDQGLNMTRIKILPEILNSLVINRKNKYPQMVFENGFVIFEDDLKDTKSCDNKVLSVCIADPKSNYTQIKSILDTLSKLQDLEFKIKEDFNENFLIKGRSANIYFKEKKVGFIGEISPKILDNFGLLVPVSCFEINLTKIFHLL